MSARALGTVLAALRAWQRQGCVDRSSEIMDIATDGDEHDPLDEAEVDALCEHLNMTPKLWIMLEAGL